MKGQSNFGKIILNISRHSFSVKPAHGDACLFPYNLSIHSGVIRILESNYANVTLGMPRKGASIKYVRKIFGILDPLPPLVRKITQPPLLSSSPLSAFGHTPPPPSARPYLMEAP